MPAGNAAALSGKPRPPSSKRRFSTITSRTDEQAVYGSTPSSGFRSRPRSDDRREVMGFVRWSSHHKRLLRGGRYGNAHRWGWITLSGRGEGGPNRLQTLHARRLDLQRGFSTPSLPGILPIVTEGGKATRESNFCERSALLLSLPQKGKVRQQIPQFKNLHLKA